MTLCTSNKLECTNRWWHCFWYRFSSGTLWHVYRVTMNQTQYIFIYIKYIYIKYPHFCFALFGGGYMSCLWIHVIYIPISFRVASLALGQSYDCPSASEATQKDMGKSINTIYTTNHELCALFLGMFCEMNDYKNQQRILEIIYIVENTCIQNSILAGT